MKNLVLFSLVLIIALASCERKSGRLDKFENTKVVLTDGTNHAVTLQIRKIGVVNINYDLLRSRFVVANAKTRNSCKLTYTYKPYAVFVEVSKFGDTIYYIRYRAKNGKDEEINLITTTVYSLGEIYEFYIDELKS